jgi:hypothetical protein
MPGEPKLIRLHQILVDGQSDQGLNFGRQQIFGGPTKGQGGVLGQGRIRFPGLELYILVPALNQIEFPGLDLLGVRAILIRPILKA